MNSKEQLKTRNNKEVKVGKRTHKEAETFWKEVTGITALDTHRGSGRDERSPSSQKRSQRFRNITWCHPARHGHADNKMCDSKINKLPILTATSFFFFTNLKYPCIFFNSLVSIFNFYFIIEYGQFTMLCATISIED